MATLKENTLDALKAIGKWSTYMDVYTYMKNNNISVGNSKTPADSVSAVLTNAKKNNILRYRYNENKIMEYGYPEWEVEDPVVPKDEKKTKETFHERDLHQLLCNYLWKKKEYPKTIYQEQSSARSDSAQKWVHPDMVSASFVETKKIIVSQLLKATEANDAMLLCSYELKIKIATDYELKQAYFQSLSNSNWANYGYLVAFEIKDEGDLIEEMERLNQSFGIGIIKLGVTPEETKVLFPAKKKSLDFKTIDKLCNINEGFLEFIETVTKLITVGKDFVPDVKNTLKSICDKRLSESDTKVYCIKKNIPF